MGETLLSMALVKSHLRIEHDDDDTYLNQLAAAALSNFEQFTGRRLVPDSTQAFDLAENDIWLTPDITQGALMLIGHWYEHRELVGEKNLNPLPGATYALWSPYVLFHLGDTGE